MELFKKIKNSIYNPNYYSELIEKPFSYSLKYYLVFTLLIAFLGMIILSFTAVPSIKSFLDTVGSDILNQYPNELEIVIKNGKASTNVSEPYFVAASEEWKGGEKNIFVIDTKNPFSIEGFKNYQTECLLTQDSLACYDENGTIKITSLAQIPNFTLNKDTVSSFFNKITPFFKLTYPIFIIGAWLGIFTGYTFRFVYLLFAAILVWIIAKIKKVKIGYGKSYQLSMHLLTLPIIITFLFNYIIKHFVTGFSIPYFFIVLFLIMAVINLKPRAVAEPQNSESPSL